MMSTTAPPTALLTLKECGGCNHYQAQQGDMIVDL